KTPETQVLRVSGVPAPHVFEKPKGGFGGFEGTPPPRFSENAIGAKWLLIEGDRTREVTTWPPATRPEVERLHPGTVVQLDVRSHDEPDLVQMREAATWGLVLGERDLDM